MYNVLIVDEEEHLLSALEKNLFPERDDIAILTASDGETGFSRLKDSRVDLLVSDIKMPGEIDGFQLILRAKEVAPDARVIIMTAFGSNRVQNFADRIGITHYIEKPFNTSELRDAILEILDEKEGFQGVLSDLELTDIIQMLCLARRTALLHLKHRDHRGRIVFDEGAVIHAEFDELVGADAVYRMLALRQGDIFMQGDFKNDQHTIELGWQDLLFEGVKRADEERAQIEPDELTADEGDDEEGPNTDVGMGLTSSDLDSMLQGGPDIDDESHPEGSFFSEAELREIERAGEEALQPDDDEEDENLPFATLSEGSDDVLPEGRFVPGVSVPAGEEMDDDFRTPFQRERSAMMADAAVSAAPIVASKNRAAPAAAPEPEEPVSVDSLGTDEFQAFLDSFARECPGLRQTGIISPIEGLALNFIDVSAGYDPEAVAAFFGDIAVCAQRIVDSFGDDRWVELQIATGDEFMLLRALEGTTYLHVAVVDRDVSLGVALVLMRRFHKKLLKELGA